MPQSVASGLFLRCLPMPHKKDPRLILAKVTFQSYLFLVLAIFNFLTIILYIIDAFFLIHWNFRT